MRIGDRRFTKFDLQVLAADEHPELCKIIEGAAEYHYTVRQNRSGARDCRNRHGRRRWLRDLREVSAVAHDAMLAGDRGRAIRLLLEVVELDVAIAMCAPRRLLEDALDDLRDRIASAAQIPSAMLLGEVPYNSADYADAAEIWCESQRNVIRHIWRRQLRRAVHQVATEAMAMSEVA